MAYEDALSYARISTISAHGRALKQNNRKFGTNAARISTISAHGRALKHRRRLRVGGLAHLISTISAHGRALKHVHPPLHRKAGRISTISAHGRALKLLCFITALLLAANSFQQFRLTVEH